MSEAAESDFFGTVAREPRMAHCWQRWMDIQWAELKRKEAEQRAVFWQNMFLLSPPCCWCQCGPGCECCGHGLLGTDRSACGCYDDTLGCSRSGLPTPI